MLIGLLVEHWRLLPAPLLYVSLAFKRRRDEYYQRLSAVRSNGDWEGWTGFFLDSVCEAADDAVATAQRLFARINTHRQRMLNLKGVTIGSIRLFDQLPLQPVVTLARATELLKTSKPTASKAIDTMRRLKILRELTGRPRDRVYAYHGYLEVLTKDTD